MQQPFIKLRGHHLICLHFFNGGGYSAEFIENLKEALKKAEAGEKIEVQPGPDNICKKCPHLKEDKCVYKEDSETKIRAMDKKALELLGIKTGTEIKWQNLRERIPGIFDKWKKKYCTECTWKGICEENPFYILSG